MRKIKHPRNIRIELLFLFFILSFKSFCAEEKYAVSGISENLKKDAAAVVRISETFLDIISSNKAIYRVHSVVTILNAEGKKHNGEVVFYDKFIAVSSFKGNLYDKDGRLIRKLKSSEIEDVSAVSDFSLYEDNRIKKADLTHFEYPYTVEYEYEIILKESFFYPNWQPLDAEKVSLEKASFHLNNSSGVDIRLKEINIDKKVRINKEPLVSKYTWELENLSSIEKEPLGPYFEELIPRVLIASNDFQFDEYKGNMSSWENLGNWHRELNKNSIDLSEATIQKLKTLTASASDDFSKIKAIYQYLQNKTRYVSIQLGIGGYQPFKASFVDTKGYGDCKALSNYTKAMLEAVGIKSYFTLIYAGEHEADIIPDFPSNQFNHVILCVPLQKDTVWLECTSQIQPFGYLGSFTCGRHALLITENGGKLVKTPEYDAKKNLLIRKAEISLNTEGNGTAKVITKYSGLQQDDLSYLVNLMEPKDQRKYLLEHIEIPSFELLSYNFEQDKSPIPIITEHLSLDIPKYATKSGKRVFLTPNLLNRITNVPSPVDQRKTDVYIRTSFTDCDSVLFTLPDEFKSEYIPQSIRYDSKFGTYMCNYVMNKNQLIYTRSFTLNKGKYPKESYTEYVDFLKKVVKADKLQVVLVSN